VFHAILEKARELYVLCEKYHIEEYWPMVFGIILAFFGVCCIWPYV